jgi:hypothetical protein
MSDTERGLINRMVAGLCEGVQQSDSAWFAPLCISVTGVRFDADAGYYLFRDPEHWLSENMRARCNGLPVLAGADPGPMNSSEFGKRCIGVVAAAYVDNDSLMCIARIANDSALRIIAAGAYDSRLTAHFDNDAPAIDIDDCKLVIEPAPRYLSHISIVPQDSVPFEYGFTIVNKAFGTQKQKELCI